MRLLKVLVTGGCGFIGLHVVDKFIRDGHDVVVIDNLSAGNPEALKRRCALYRLDVEDLGCETVFMENRPEVVVHLAAQTDVNFSLKVPYTDARSNILGTVNMLEQSAKHGVKKLVFASSAAVFGNSADLPLVEETAFDPVSPYGMSKMVGEFYCKKWKDIYGLETLVLRFSNVYGPGQGTAGEGGVVSIFIKRLLQGKELVIFGNGAQTRDFIYVEDLVECLYSAVIENLSGVFHLSTDTETSVNDIVEILSSLHPVKGVAYAESREGDILRSRLCNAKIRRELGWCPSHTIYQGLRKTFDWFGDCRENLLL